MKKLLIILLLFFIPFAQAEPLATSYWGYVTVDSAYKTNALVTVFDSSGKEVARATSTSNAIYQVTVPWDDSATQADEGVVNGETITFNVDGKTATPKKIDPKGTNIRLDLTVTSASTATPTPTPTPTITSTVSPTPTATPTPTVTPTPVIVTSTGNVTRRISPSIIPTGSQINITLTPSPQDMFDNPGFQVIEVLPSGFLFVGTPSGYEYRNNVYTFTQIGINPIEYMLIAPSVEGNYTISGTFKDELQNTGIVTGTTRITIGGSLLSSYDMNGNGRIDRSEAVQAVMDYFSSRLTRQQAIEMVMAYFNG